MLLLFFLCHWRFDDFGVFADFVVNVFEEDGLWAIWVKPGWVAREVLMTVGEGLHVAGVGENVADGVRGIDNGVDRAFQWWRVWIFDDFDFVRCFDDGGVVADFVVDVFKEDKLRAIWIKFGWIAWEVLVTVGVGLHVAGIVQHIADGVYGAGDGAYGCCAWRWLQRFVGEHFVVHRWDVNAVFFDGVAAGWVVFAVGVTFQAFCLADDVTHFAEETDDVVLDNRCGVLERCFIFRLAELLDGES